ncbi:MAG: HupE/UreJ family protein [Ferruginibacter sp.]|nr:HupE/UreJ family protein [Ferruginibacter sp.]
MDDFGLYFKTGWQHIISWDALDHILFIVALAAIYLATNWKQVLVLVTAFTIGHSLTLALSVYDVIRLNGKWVEFLIPCTIISTALFNFFVKDYQPTSLRVNYFLALFFGLVHGMGFANTIRFMLAKDQNIAIPLISFNIGLEVGQIIIVALLLFVSYLVVSRAGLKRKWWVWALSGIALVVALGMAKNRWPL